MIGFGISVTIEVAQFFPDESARSVYVLDK